MLIRKLTIPDNALNNGLSEVKMRRLGKIVAISGKNGAGKTRLLGMVEASSIGRTTYLRERTNWAEATRQLKVNLEANPGHTATDAWKRELNSLEDRISLASWIETSIEGEFRTLRFVPKTLESSDPSNMPPDELRRAGMSITDNNLNEFSKYCFAYLKRIQDRWWSATHQAFSGDAALRESATNEYEALQDLLQSLFGARLERSPEDDVLLFGRPIARAGLSDGQKVILQLLSAMHAQKASLEHTLFIMDELENHLHPSIAIDFLTRLVGASSTSQVWIATHSVPLLAHIAALEPMAIWCMQDGVVSHAGRRPETVLRDLLGDDERIGQLAAFVGLPSQLAATNFASECFLPPEAVVAELGDPQLKQIASILQSKMTGQTLGILDYGAGRGRLLDGLSAASPTRPIDELIDYYAFDLFPENKDECESVIAEYYGNAEKRYFSSIEEFSSLHASLKVDVLVMCNVLHEIVPGEWQAIFSDDNSIGQSVLSGSGFILIVEDQRIPVGERAHEFGFLVLDTRELECLFGVTSQDRELGHFVTNDWRGDGRLKAHLVAQPLLKRVTRQSILKAINSLAESSLDRIEATRALSPSYTNGLAHGFWTQQFANATLFLKRSIASENPVVHTAESDGHHQLGMP